MLTLLEVEKSSLFLVLHCACYHMGCGVLFIAYHPQNIHLSGDKAQERIKHAGCKA